MAGGSQHQKPSGVAAAGNRKSRWESGSTNNSNQNPKSNNSNRPSDSGKKPSNDQTKPTTSSSAKPAAPSPKPAADRIPYPDPPLPSYGFHMLERRTIVLFDGSVRSYFALPPDYQDFAPPPLRFPESADIGVGPGRFPPGVPMSPDGFGRGGRSQDYWNSLGLDGRVGEGSLKRKYGEEDDWSGELRQRINANSGNELYVASNRKEEMRGGKYMRVGVGGNYDGAKRKHLEVDPNALKKAFLHFVKVVNETPAQKRKYLENGKLGPVKCVVCDRSSKDFVDVHALVMHTYSPDNADYVDHMGLHKALCVLMGWNYSKPPDNSKAYQLLSAGEAEANKDDLIVWPPTVIIHNTITGKNKDGRMEGLGNKAMDSIIRDLGCSGGKSKSLYGREGHLGMTLIKFGGDRAGLLEAERLAEYFEKENRGSKNWAHIQPSVQGKDDEKNPNLVKIDERTGERKRIFYGYLLTASDLDKLDFDTRKKVTIESRREYKSSN